MLLRDQLRAGQWSEIRLYFTGFGIAATESLAVFVSTPCSDSLEQTLELDHIQEVKEGDQPNENKGYCSWDGTLAVDICVSTGITDFSACPFALTLKVLPQLALDLR